MTVSRVLKRWCFASSSSSLKAARDFRPETLALLAKPSLFWRVRQREELDEEAFLEVVVLVLGPGWRCWSRGGGVRADVMHGRLEDLRR